MKTRFSRLLSLLLAITIVLSCVPMAVGAEDDVVITISTLVEGTVYETGTSIPLMVEHNSAPSTISHIDFYANGEKIPGNIPAGDTNKVLMWNKPLPGDYAVTAKIVYKATSVSEESDPVNIKVSGTEQEVFRFGADDSGKWTKSATSSYKAQLTDNSLSSDYTDFSAKTFTGRNIISNSKDPFSPLLLTQDVTRDTKKYKYLNVLMRTYPNDRYVEGGTNELPKFGFVIYNEKGSATKLNPSNTLNEDEWTRLSFSIAGISGTFKNLSIFANNYNGGYINDESAYGVAIAGIFLSENASETMTATPLIPEGSGVSCEMPAYRLNFNRSLNSYLTKEKLAGITITTDDGATNVSLDYKWGVDYLDLIPKASLELGKTYTVTIPENTLYDNYANYVSAQTFTFKTDATICEQATPIPYVTYPANGATVATKGVQLAAKVLFPPSDATDVVFYDNGTALNGTVTKGTGNEFVLNDVELAAGEHTITAKVGDAISQPVTITAAATTKYETLGVQDGDRVILNPQVEGYSSFQNKITVVDFSQTTELIGTTTTPSKFTANPTATNVSQVIFDLDGVITFDTEAPYEFPLTNAHQGEHTLKVHVLSNNGAVWSETVRFTGIVGAIYDSESEDYENVSDGTVFRTYPPSSNLKYSIETNNGSKMYKIYNDGTEATNKEYNGNNYSSFLPETRMEQNLGDAKIFYVDFDYVRSTGVEFQMHFQRRYTYPVSDHNVKFGKLRNFKGTESGHITMIMDCQNGVVSAYHNGTMYWYSKITDQKVLSNFQKSSAVSAMLYVANVSTDRCMYVDNLNIRTYSSAAVGDYALSGITANSDLAANVNNYKVNVSVVDNVAAPETSATLKKAVFKLNGATIKTAIEAPFSCDVPLKTLGANKLTVETTDSYGVIKTINVPFTVSFKVDGASITELRADPGHAADKAVVANPGKEASYILYTAVYTSDKALKTVTTEEIKIGANEIKFHEANVTLGEGETVRLFTWKENLYPLD